MKGKETTEITTDNWDNTIVVPNIKAVEKLLRESGKSKIMFVLLIGSYQIGKSTKIAYFINSNKVAIGNGSREETSGVWIYGPVSYNEFRQRFGCDKVPDDDTCIYFIDTEGNCGFHKGSSAEETTLLLSQIIAPYAALSNVTLTISKPSITSDEVQQMEKMLDIFNIIRSSGNQKYSSIINVVNDIYTENDKYKIKEEETQKTFLKRSKIYNNNFVILPKYNQAKNWNEQDNFYIKGFRHFTKKLIIELERCKNDSFTDWEEAFEVFKGLIGITKNQNLGSVAHQAKMNAKKSTYERLFKHDVDTIIQDKINEIIKIQDDFLEQKEILSIPEIDKDSIIEDVKNIIKEKVPSSIQNESFENSLKEAEEKITNQITKFLEKVFIKAQNDVKNKSINKLINIIAKYEHKIETNQGNDILEVLPYNTKDNIHDKINKFISNIINESGFSDDVQTSIINEMNQMIHIKLLSLYIKAFKQIYPRVVRQSIEKFEEEYINKHDKVEENDINRFFETVKSNINTNIPNEIKKEDEFKELEKQMEKDIKEDIKTHVNQKIFVILIKSKIDKTFDKEAKQIKKIENVDEILPESRIFEIKNEFSKEIESLKNEYDKNEIENIIQNKIDKLCIYANKRKQEIEEIENQKMIAQIKAEYEKEQKRQEEILEDLKMQIQKLNEQREHEIKERELDYKKKLEEIKEKEEIERMKKEHEAEIEKLKQKIKEQKQALQWRFTLQKDRVEQVNNNKKGFLQTLWDIGSSFAINYFFKNGLTSLISQFQK